MPDIFIQTIQKFQEWGLFNFMFPYMLTSAIFYGLLRKSEIFGKPEKNVTVNGVVALIAAFMVWAYPILTGVDIETQLATFFTHGLIVTLVLMMGLMLMGMFMPPDLPEQFRKTIFEKGGPVGVVLVATIIIGVFVFVTSGLLNLIVGPVLVRIPSDILLTIGMLILLIVPFIFILKGGGKPAEEKKEEEKE